MDLEDARDALTKAEVEKARAELRMAVSVRRLLAEKLTVTELGELTGLEQPLLRRLRHLKPAGVQVEGGS